MESCVNPQSALQLSTCQKRLGQHCGQEGWQSIIISVTRHFDAHLHPLISPDSFGCVCSTLLIAVFVLVFIVHLHVETKLMFTCSWSPLALFNLRFDSDNGLRAVGKAHSCAAVCAGEYVGLSHERPELR